MRKEKEFYVYKHVRLDNNETFYVGKGTKKRAYLSFHRNNYWKNIVKKSNYVVYIIKDSLTEEEAYLLEYKLISLYKRYGRASANLNTDYGLGGRLGRTNDDYKKIGKKISLSTIGKRSGSNNPNFGKITPEEVRLKISIGNKGYLRPQSKEHVIKRTINNRKKILDIKTNIVYDYIEDILCLVKISKSHLRSQLNGRLKNNTNFRYL